MATHKKDYQSGVPMGQMTSNPSMSKHWRNTKQTNDWTNEPANEPTNEPTNNEPINEAMNERTNQPTNEPTFVQ